MLRVSFRGVLSCMGQFVYVADDQVLFVITVSFRHFSSRVLVETGCTLVSGEMACPQSDPTTPGSDLGN